MPDAKAETDRFMTEVRKRNPHEEEFHQAVEESVRWLMPFVLDHDAYRKARILERMTEPDRVIQFRVTWQDDDGGIRFNRAWRVQFNNAIGPYKGGLRFDESVNLGILKFLGFEQTLKNSLTGLPMGGAKGGANFSPRGKSDDEVMRFCHALMLELHRHIGEDTDVPAGDIGVSQREISYLFGQYKRLTNRFVGTLTGKGVGFGGSAVRTEATGFGAVMFLRDMLDQHDDGLDGKKAAVSGSGNVALYAIDMLGQLGAKVVTASDSDGFIHDPDGIEGEKLAWLKELKEERRGRIREYAEEFDVEFHEGRAPWNVPVDLALPCATQNELDTDAAQALIANGVCAVVEGANMPCSTEAIHAFLESDVLFGPGKAANAGGVAVSGLEQSQNAQRVSWDREEVCERLNDIMGRVHAACVEYGSGSGPVNYVKGSNIAGFKRVADALLAYGAV